MECRQQRTGLFSRLPLQRSSEAHAPWEWVCGNLNMSPARSFHRMAEPCASHIFLELCNHDIPLYSPSGEGHKCQDAENCGGGGGRGEPGAKFPQCKSMGVPFAACSVLLIKAHFSRCSVKIRELKKCELFSTISVLFCRERTMSCHGPFHHIKIYIT